MKSMGLSSALAIAAVFAVIRFSRIVSAQSQSDLGMDYANITCSRYIELIVLRISARSAPSRRVRAKFKLFTRNNQLGDWLSGIRRGRIPPDSYDANKETKLIIHGFLGRGTLDWVERLKEALLDWRDINVITVDWSKAAATPYPTAVLNTPYVGSQITKLVNHLIQTKGGNSSMFHLIGHSLGAQIAGYAGKGINGLGRITGLDPAGPLFTNNPTSDRLNHKDANFVDVIHTDTKCLGITLPSGHLDFYPNGGSEQPGCAHADFERYGIIGNVVEVLKSAACSHSRSVELFTESIVSQNASCQLMGVLCDSYDSFLRGKCDSAAPNDTMIAPMGINADKYSERIRGFITPRKFYLKTNSNSPYCAEQDFYFQARNMIP